MSSRPSVLRRAAREPLLHFALLGAVIFCLHHALAPGAPSDERVIVLDDRYLEALAEQEARAGGDADREAIAARWIRDEALAREAVRLGLDRGDDVVRRRLIQKMELWLDANLDPPEPSADEIDAELAAHPERYRAPARLDFEQVFFSSGREQPEEDARDALDRLRAGEDPATLGDPILLGRRSVDRSERQIADRYGAPFARALVEGPLDRWRGPLTSALGAHLARVTRISPAAPRADARDRARAEVARAARADALRSAERSLVERYRVARGSAPSPARLP